LIIAGVIVDSEKIEILKEINVMKPDRITRPAGDTTFLHLPAFNI